MLIDTHTHLFPDLLAGRTLQKLSEISGCPYCTDGTVAGTQRYFAQSGVDFAVVLHIATKPEQQTNVNNFARQVQDENPNLICFGSVHPDASDALEELYRIKELGLHGVKLHPDYQKVFIREERYFPLFETMSKLGLPVAFHTGWDPVSPGITRGSSKDVAVVARAFPRLTVIAAHMGGLNRYEEAQTYLAGLRNVYFDTAMSSAYFRSPELYERLIRRHGLDRVLFGTDCPWSTVDAELRFLNQTSLTEAEKAQIAFENAKRLFDI
ncbi:amidohydrolase family protein [Marasmitruncus massiliensis]|uniref:amidohydrolase family protein n=1 Tax=Marasmitruncus massiliensis TaxID=1944642 RepID=UPI0015E15832|nr:amidohydrolase family protein [Marasmitruncus massiliensis]